MKTVKRIILKAYKAYLELQIGKKWNRKLSLKLDAVIDKLGE